mgnify:CR=1 FL=1
MKVSDFTGNYSRRLQVGQSYTGNGTWDGKGSLDATWIEGDNISACENSTLADNESIGSDFLIVGRTILNSKNPIQTAKKLAEDSLL